MPAALDAKTLERVKAAIEVGMGPAVWAELQPDTIAVTEVGGRTRNFLQLNANANRIARLMRAHGIGAGDSVALLCSNKVEFPEVLLACLRSGVRMTPVNWHLTAPEIAYVIENCEAKALFADARVEAAAEAAASCAALRLRVSLDGAIADFLPLEAALNPFSGADIDNPVRGSTMLYSSGTTGRPKGVHKPNAPAPGFDGAYERGIDKHICTGPAYHASPMAGDVRRPLVNGIPIVLMDKWDSELTLQTIEKERITRGHFVPIMFQRLLALPEDVRTKYDLSSIKRITHGAAPCPPEVKRAMIEWIGPRIFEYYAGSEGGVGFWITSEEWLKKPGSVGRRPHKDAAKILDDSGEELPTGTPGAIYMSLKDQGGFSYFGDDAKTQSSRRDGYFTMGDIGFFDEDDYLFLTGRSAETIIAGGVNIYPQEIDNELIKHPAIEDSCTVGIPHPEWGEEVRAVVQLRPGFAPSDALRNDILTFAAQMLAKYKAPRSVDFMDELPRSAAGKVLRNKVRAPYWEGRARQI